MYYRAVHHSLKLLGACHITLMIRSLLEMPYDKKVVAKCCLCCDLKSTVLRTKKTNEVVEKLDKDFAPGWFYHAN